MFWCENCQEDFEELLEIREYHDFFDGKHETFYVCPLCGSEEWQEARICKRCGRWMPESQALFSLCVDCERNARDKFDSMMDQLSVEERKYLSWQYEGEEL